MRQGESEKETDREVPDRRVGIGMHRRTDRTRPALRRDPLPLTIQRPVRWRVPPSEYRQMCTQRRSGSRARQSDAGKVGQPISGCRIGLRMSQRRRNTGAKCHPRAQCSRITTCGIFPSSFPHDRARSPSLLQFTSQLLSSGCRHSLTYKKMIFPSNLPFCFL